VQLVDAVSCPKEHSYIIRMNYATVSGASGRAVCRGTMLQAGRSQVKFSMSLNLVADVILPATVRCSG
jgi:hypothetical protein